MASGLARKYEINADMGEGFGRWKMGPDEELMPYIDAANIACGYHAGDPTIMLKTVRLCKKHGVKAGAHPGLQDMFGFGRRKIEIDPKDMYAMVLYQVGALKAILDSEGVELSHIKPHGELFFYMQRDETIMRAVLEACATFGNNIPVYASQNPAQEAMCKELGIPFQGEVYVDIDYSPEGKLIPVAQSKVATPELCYERALSASLKDSGKDNSGAVFSFGPVTVMDPVSAAGLAIGVASIGLQVYTGCVQGIQLLITAKNFPDDCKFLNLRLRMEQQRLFAWSETSGLLDLDGNQQEKILSTNTFMLHRTTVLDLLVQVQCLFKEFEEHQRRNERLRPAPDQDTILEHPEKDAAAANFPLPERRKDFIKRAMGKLKSQSRENFLRLSWVSFDKGAFEILLSRFAALNDNMTDILDARMQVEIRDTVQDTNRGVLQLHHRIADLGRLVMALNLKLENTAPANISSMSKAQREKNADGLELLSKLAKFKAFNESMEPEKQRPWDEATAMSLELGKPAQRDRLVLDREMITLFDEDSDEFGQTSHNIVFFRTKSGRTNYAEPYLTGFDYSRPARSDEATDIPQDDAEYNLYRHPHVQLMNPAERERFKKSFDIYSLGVLFVEIAHWAPVDKILGYDISRRPSLALRVRDALLVEDRIAELGANMGEMFEEAARKCIAGGESLGLADGDVETEDIVAAQLSMRFYEDVVKKLDGVRV
ncbi:glycoside hydrolase family protein [Colletotrichum incanum]|nr:glycoside hydrolase family protein [Colletotrichum incanum]